MKNRHFGKFEIDSKIISEDPDLIIDAFSIIRFLPVRAESLLSNSSIEYIGISERFEEVAMGTQIPEYKIIITRDERGITVEVKRAD